MRALRRNIFHTDRRPAGKFEYHYEDKRVIAFVCWSSFLYACVRARHGRRIESPAGVFVRNMKTNGMCLPGFLCYRSIKEPKCSARGLYFSRDFALGNMQCSEKTENKQKRGMNEKTREKKSRAKWEPNIKKRCETYARLISNCACTRTMMLHFFLPHANDKFSTLCFQLGSYVWRIDAFSPPRTIVPCQFKSQFFIWNLLVLFQEFIDIFTSAFIQISTIMFPMPTKITNFSSRICDSEVSKTDVSSPSHPFTRVQLFSANLKVLLQHYGVPINFGILHSSRGCFENRTTTHDNRSTQMSWNSVRGATL